MRGDVRGVGVEESKAEEGDCRRREPDPKDVEGSQPFPFEEGDPADRGLAFEGEAIADLEGE